MFNNRSEDADERQWPDGMDSDGLFGMEDMQAWADSIAAAGGVLGAVYEEGGMLTQGQYMRAAEPIAEPAKADFDPEECTVLRAPMTLRRARICLTSRKNGFFS